MPQRSYPNPRLPRCSDMVQNHSAGELADGHDIASENTALQKGPKLATIFLG